MKNIGNILAVIASGVLTANALSQERAQDSLLDERMKVEVPVINTQKEKYQSWIDSTIQASRKQNNYAIVVRKLQRRLDLYYTGEVIKSFEIGLGLNPINDKFFEGDFCTPEGMYKVSWMRDGDEVKTAFYKALMINYPTRQDSLEFRIIQNAGLIPEDIISPGGNIEIHGCGGKRDWTAGCIALDDIDMDYLFERVRLETPVTIVKY